MSCQLTLALFGEGDKTNGFNIIGASKRTDINGDFGPWKDVFPNDLDDQHIYVKNRNPNSFYPIMGVYTPFDILDSSYRVHGLYLVETAPIIRKPGLLLIAEFLTKDDAIMFKLLKP